MKICWITAAALALAPAAHAQDNWDQVVVSTEPVAGAVHVIYGAGGNIGVSAGSDGVYIVDDQYAPLSERIKATVADISAGPIRYVINTHFHMDHTGGNENIGGSGAVVVAHDNVRLRLTKGAFIKAFNVTMPPAEGKTLPVITFSDQISFHMNGEETRVIHVDNAHTDGDSIVWFKGSNVIHMGDTYFNDRLPFIDVPHGGSIDGVISAAQMVLSVADGQTRIIPGHGPVSDKTGLEAYHAMLLDARNRIATLKEQGVSLKDIQARKPLEGLDAKWLAKGDDWTNNFISFVFDSL